MDLSEKAAAHEGQSSQGQAGNAVSSAAFVDAPQRTRPQPADSEKDDIQKEIQNKHLSLASSADAYKRESIETAPRASTYLSDSASERSMEGAPSLLPQDEVRPPAARSRVTLNVPEGEHETRNRPVPSRGNTAASGITVISSRRSMPSLRRKETKLAQKEAHPWEHLGITLGLPAILFFDLVVPCIVYYVWYDINRAKWKKRCRAEHPEERPCPIEQPQYDSEILGYAVICFGLGELWILIARVWRLFFHRDECAPLLSRSKWELDATSWVYGVAMLLALIPFVVGAELLIPQLYLYAPSFIMGFLGILMFITTLCPIKLPIGINSQPRGSRLRPFLYYAAEDFIAVDGLQDREFRVRYNERYESNAMFRRFFFNLTLFWLFGVFVYIGCSSAIIWNLEFHYAFGVTFGFLFSWIFVWAGLTYLWVEYEMKREAKAYEEGIEEKA